MRTGQLDIKALTTTLMCAPLRPVLAAVMIRG